jgi:hypothetical protein
MTELLRDLSGQGISGFSRERWNPETDIRGFASVLFDILVACPVIDGVNVPANIPRFVSEMIRTRFSREWRRLSSCQDIFEILKQHNFQIVSGVD